MKTEEFDIKLPKNLIHEMTSRINEFRSEEDCLNAIAHRLTNLKTFARLNGQPIQKDFIVSAFDGSIITQIQWFTGFTDQKTKQMLILTLTAAGRYFHHTWQQLPNIPELTALVRGVLPDVPVGRVNAPHIAHRRGRGSGAYFTIENLTLAVEHARDSNVELIRTIHHNQVTWFVPIPVLAVYAVVGFDKKTTSLEIHTLLKHSQVQRHMWSADPSTMKKGAVR